MKAEWDKSVRSIKEAKVDKVILDLRSNPGGYFDAAIYAVDDILNEGFVISNKEMLKEMLRNMNLQREVL